MQTDSRDAGLKTITVTSPFPEERAAILQVRNERGLLSRFGSRLDVSVPRSKIRPKEPSYLHSGCLSLPLSDRSNFPCVTVNPDPIESGCQAISFPIDQERMLTGGTK